MQSQLRIVLEAIRGPATGQRALVQPDSPLIIGRAPDATFCIAEDPTISRYHLQIDWSPPECRLTSLSANGTFVNQAPVTRLELMDGDEIGIGTDTILRLSMREEQGSARVTQPLPGRNQTAPVAFSASTCPSGLMRYVADPQTALDKLLPLLARQTPLFAIINFNRLGQPTPETLTAKSALFDWLPAELICDHSPHLLPFTSDDCRNRVTTGWGQDAVIVLQSAQPYETLVGHLRQAFRFDGQGRARNRPGTALGYCWPAILDQILTNSSPRLIESLLNGVEAVVIESDEAPAGWQLLASAAYAPRLVELGFQPDTTTQATLKAAASKH